MCRQAVGAGNNNWRLSWSGIRRDNNFFLPIERELYFVFVDGPPECMKVGILQQESIWI